jgi:hypothetical protein
MSDQDAVHDDGKTDLQAPPNEATVTAETIVTAEPATEADWAGVVAKDATTKSGVPATADEAAAALTDALA